MADVALVLEAAADGSVAVLRDGVVLYAAQVPMRGVAADRLFPAVLAAVEAAGGVEALSRVICGSGPGSFTSLRVAAGIAKGLCAGGGLPLYAVPSLALGVPGLAPGRHLLTLDALRGECYAAVYDWDGRVVRAVGAAAIVPAADLASLAARAEAGIAPAVPRAAFFPALRDGDLVEGPVDRAAWEPAYGRLAEAQVRWEATHGRPLAP